LNREHLLIARNQWNLDNQLILWHPWILELLLSLDNQWNLHKLLILEHP
jgi:hypothetical protein